MATIKFTIKGNQEKPDGNPIPYLRTTQGSQWTDKAIRYREWKSKVVAAYIDALDAMEKAERQQFGSNNDLAGRKPIKATKNKMRMDLMIYWKDDTHGDCDNVFKGIADALFMNDKYLAGSFDFAQAKAGSVEVTIHFT